MPVSEHEEVGLSPQASDPIAGVPIKKRPFRTSQPSCSSSEASSQESEGPCKKPFIWRPESSALDNGACSALGTRDITNGSIAHPRVGLSADDDVNLVSRHRSLVKPEFQVFGLKNATDTGKVVAKIQDLNMDDKSVSWSAMENNQLLTDLRKLSELPIGKGSGEETFALGDRSAFQRDTKIPELQLGSTTDVRKGGNYVKQEKVDYCSGDLPITGTCYTFQRQHSDADSEVDFPNQSMNRSNWDLNIPIDTWVSSENDPVMEHGGNDSSDQGGISKGKFGTCPLEATSRGANSNYVPFAKHASQKGNIHLGSSSSMPADLSQSEVGLDLQLKPPSKPELRINWVASELRLSLTGNPMTDASFKPVKSEPCEASSEQNVQKMEAGSVESVSFRRVKSEPCDGNLLGDAAPGTGSGDPKPACGKLVKSEPTEGSSQECTKRSMESSPSRACDGSITPSGGAEVRLDAREAREIDLNSETVCEDDKLHDGIVNPNVATTLGDVRGCKLSLKTEDVQSDTSVLQDAGVVVGKPPDSVSASRTCEVANPNSTSLLETAVPDHKEPVAHDGMSEGSADMDCTDDDHNTNLSKLATVDELLVDSYGKENKERTCLSGEIQKGETCGPKDELNNSHGVIGVQDKHLKLTGSNCELEAGEANGEKVLSHVNVRDKQVQIASKIQKSDGDFSSYTNDIGVTSSTGPRESSTVRAPTPTSSKKRLMIKPSHGTSQDQPRKEQAQEIKSKSSGSPSVKSVERRHDDDVGSRQEKARGSDVLAKQSVSSERDAAANGSAVKHVDRRSKHPKIKEVDSASNRLSFGKTKSFSSRSDSSQIEGERSRHDRSRSRGSRHERDNDRSLKYENGKSQDQPVAKRGSDVLNARWTNRHLRALHCDRNSEPEFSYSKGLRGARLKNGSDDAFAVSSDGPGKRAGRMVRRLPEDEPLRLSRFLPRRRSPVDGFRVRNVSPGRCIGGEVPDSVILSHEEKFMRAMPDDMLEPFPFPHPRLQYEQTENILIRRERRSLSPIPRGGPLVHLPRGRSPHQWSPPRRSPDAFDGHLEIMRCRSPPVMRIRRIRSPGQRPCFPEDTMLRRRGIPGDPRDNHLLEDHDLPRFDRDLQRNVRRFEVIGPEESVDGEHAGPMHFPQLPESTGNDEFVDRRKFDLRHGFGRPFGQRRFVGGDDGEEGLSFPAEDGPSRPVRFCTEEDEVFPDRGSPRDFDGHVRNRIGSISNRLRGMGDREERRFHGAQGWRDSAFNDLRMKRGRF